MDELVPREYWAEFCERFTHQHHGWLATLEEQAVRSAAGGGMIGGPGALLEFRGLRLAEEAGREVLYLTATGQGGEDHTSTVYYPVRLTFKKADDGAHSGVRVDGRNGERLVLRFRVPALPEALNGLMANSAK